MRKIQVFGFSLFAAAIWGICGAQEQRVTVDIGPQPIRAALRQFGEQTGLQISFRAEEVASDWQASPVRGSLSAGEALKRMLAELGLEYEFVNERTVRIAAKTAAGVTGADGSFRLVQADEHRDGIGQGEPQDTQRVAQVAQEGVKGEATEDEENPWNEEDPERSGIPEILVTGSKLGTLNMDIKRTPDDIQPYVVFDREALEQSGSPDLDQFLKNDLTMNASAFSANENAGSTANRSSINLRGLGTDETLILVDGRRMAPVADTATLGQSGVNGIPLAAIERIEVLPTTASGIYGASATGGVVNIVLRRDYSGLEAKATYGNTFVSGASSRRLDMNAGLDFGAGKTRVLFFGSYADTNPLFIGDRNFNERRRAHILANNPAFFYDDAPPQGTTPNIRSNDLLDGVRQNLVLDNGTPLNATITFVPEGYSGRLSDDGAALVANAGQYNLGLAHTADRADGRRGTLLNGSEEKSVMLTARHELSSRVQAFLEFQHSESSWLHPINMGWSNAGAANMVVIPGSAPNNPFQQSIEVTLPAVGLDGDNAMDLESLGAVGGFIVDLAAQWRASVDFTWGRSRTYYSVPAELSLAAQSAMADGSIDVLRDLNQHAVILEPNPYPSEANSPADATIKTASLRFAGPLPWSMPGGSPSLSILTDIRKESLDDSIRSFGQSQTLFPGRSQQVKSIYLESRIPLVSARNDVPGIESLDLQLAVRRDDYSVTGATNSINLGQPLPVNRFTRDDSSLNPTIGLRYKPVADLALRASYGTGFRPPGVTDLIPNNPFPFNLGRLSIRDPLRGNERVGSVLITQGGSPDLDPEESRTWSAGLIFTPRSLPELRVSADWTEIEKTDEITGLGLSQASFDQFVTYLPHRITRAAPSDGFAFGRVTDLNITRLNIAQLNMRALDLAFDYDVQANRLGEFAFSLRTTRLFTLESQTTPSAAVVENVGVLPLSSSTGGLKWKGNATLSWTYAQWNVGWRSHFFDSYFLNVGHTVDVNQGSAEIPRQHYHDLFGGYRFPSDFAVGVMAGADVRFGINNVFNKEPPLDVNRSYAALGDPRLANYYVSMSKSFGGR